MTTRQPAQGMQMQTEREFLMEAPLLKALDAQLKSCRTQKEWAIVRAKQALYWARTYRIAEAAEVPDEIRRAFRGREDPEVFFWIWLAEGVIDFYESATTAGIGYLNRARAIAVSMKLKAHEEYVSAWLANACLRDDKYDQMIGWLNVSAMDRAEFVEATCRSSIVAAVAFQSVGDDQLAAQWFGRARDSARRIGDRATIMASIENRALMRLDRVWVNHVLDDVPITEIDAIETELLGALQYERITGSESFAAQGDVARIRLHILRGRLELALRDLEEKSDVLSEGKFPTANALVVLREWLLIKVRGIANVDSHKLDKLEVEISSFDDDDACVSWRYLSRIAQHCGDQSRVGRYISESERALGKYLARTEYLRLSINQWKRSMT